MKLQPDTYIVECSNGLLGLNKRKPFMDLFFFIDRLFGYFILSTFTPISDVNPSLENNTYWISLLSFDKYTIFTYSAPKSSVPTCRDGPAP